MKVRRKKSQHLHALQVWEYPLCGGSCYVHRCELTAGAEVEDDAALALVRVVDKHRREEDAVGCATEEELDPTRSDCNSVVSCLDDLDADITYMPLSAGDAEVLVESCGDRVVLVDAAAADEEKR